MLSHGFKDYLIASGLFNWLDNFISQFFFLRQRLSLVIDQNEVGDLAQ